MMTVWSLWVLQNLTALLLRVGKALLIARLRGIGFLGFYAQQSSLAVSFRAACIENLTDGLKQKMPHGRRKNQQIDDGKK